MQFLDKTSFSNCSLDHVDRKNSDCSYRRVLPQTVSDFPFVIRMLKRQSFDNEETVAS